jgi:hypothetical protein
MTKEELQKMCENFDTYNLSLFRKIVAGFVELDSSNEKKLRRYCCTDKGTISRWINSHSTPHPAMRPAVINFIMENLKEGG